MSVFGSFTLAETATDTRKVTIDVNGFGFAGKRPATDDEMVTSSSNASGESGNYDSRRGVWSPGGVLSDITEVKIKTEVMDTANALEHCNIDETSSQSNSLVTPPLQSPALEAASTPSREASPQNPQDAIDAMNATAAQNKRRRIGTTSSNKNKSLEEELCSICGDRASGYHYNALSCEGCKGFFRRSITRGSTYKCKYGGNCEMDMWMRRRCQSCRLKRCREVGMKEECLLSEEQCKARDVRRKARQKVLNQAKDPEPPDSSSVAEKRGLPTVNDNPLEALTEENRELIQKLVTNQEKYELPSEEDIARLANVKIKDREEPSELSDAIYKQMASVTIMVTQLVVEFAKHLPGFMTLNRDDQIVLLKGSSCEIMMIRTARRYDTETDTIVFADGMPYTRDNLRFAGLHDYVDFMFHYCRGMDGLAVDNAEYALLTAITLFSVRPGVKDCRKVEEIQEMYARVLEAYDKARRGKGPHFAKLLMSLVELRTLSCEYSDALFKMKVEKGSLPPLLCEYFDVVD